MGHVSQRDSCAEYFYYPCALLFASCSTSCWRFHWGSSVPVWQLSLCLPGLTPCEFCWEIPPRPLAFGSEQLCWGMDLRELRAIRAGRRSWMCLHSEHSVAARCNHNMLFSAVLKATLPYHFPEYYYYYYYYRFCGMGVEYWEGAGICRDLGQGCLCFCFDFLF